MRYFHVAHFLNIISSYLHALYVLHYVGTEGDISWMLLCVILEFLLTLLLHFYKHLLTRKGYNEVPKVTKLTHSLDIPIFCTFIYLAEFLIIFVVKINRPYSLTIVNIHLNFTWWVKFQYRTHLRCSLQVISSMPNYF